MTDRVAPSGAASGHAAGYLTRALRAIGHDFRVRTWDQGLTAHLDTLFGGLALEGAPARASDSGPATERDGPPTERDERDGPPGERDDRDGSPNEPDERGGRDHRVAEYELADRGRSAEWRYALLRDGAVLKAAHRPSFLLGRLVGEVNRSAIASAAGRTTLHAAAAQLGDHTLVLPAAMDAGKSTLVAALVKAGFRYLTDEAVAISPDDLTFPPFAKPVGLEGAAKDLHADLAQEPHPLVAEWAQRLWLVPPTAFGPDAVGVRARPTIVVSARYDPQVGTRLAPASRAALVEAMARRTFGFTESGRRNLEVLARVARGAQCFEMTVDDLDEACAALRAVAEDPAPAR